MKLTKILTALCFLFITTSSYSCVKHHFESIKGSPTELYAFFKEMPKGGELHYHLSGGAYPEAMLKLMTTANYCLNENTGHLSSNTTQCEGLITKDLQLQNKVYRKIIHNWSMANFVPNAQTGSEHFFTSFYNFKPITTDFRPELLVDIIERAATQNELYLEIMSKLDSNKSASFSNLLSQDSSFNTMYHTLINNEDYLQNVNNIVKKARINIAKAKKIIGCDKNQQLPACKVEVKFQYYINREQPITSIFAQALAGFKAATKSHDIVGINLVQAEYGVVSIRDYKKQMQVFKYLHAKYPKTHIALHAGELTNELVSPDDLRFHIYDAVMTGQAERVGHGVDIVYENELDTLIKTMSLKPVAVEVNLTSNERILDVKGDKHPLNFYLNNKIPVVLSTDDEGVLRTDLTSEYVKAVTEHGLDYVTIRNINRNALTYSFLPGESIWEDPKRDLLVVACKNFASTQCKDFAKQNPKAKLQLELERRLQQFESKYITPKIQTD